MSQKTVTFSLIDSRYYWRHNTILSIQSKSNIFIWLVLMLPFRFNWIIWNVAVFLGHPLHYPQCWNSVALVVESRNLLNHPLDCAQNFFCWVCLLLSFPMIQSALPLSRICDNHYWIYNGHGFISRLRHWFLELTLSCEFPQEYKQLECQWKSEL